MTKNLLEEILDFMRLTHQFQNIERVIDIPNRETRENDAEHSYQLAMIAWYMVTKHKLPLDLTLVLKYALIHDLVEVHAGDEFDFSNNKDKLKKKKEREEIARKKLMKEFPDFKDLHHLIESYEKRTYQEAKFIWALDKLIPVWNIYLCDGKTWKTEVMTLDDLINWKTEKMKASDIVNDYYKETLKLLKEKEGELFPKK